MESVHTISIWGSVNVFVTKLFLRWKVVSLTHNPQAGEQPLDRYPPLLIQYIRS